MSNDYIIQFRIKCDKIKTIFYRILQEEDRNIEYPGAANCDKVSDFEQSPDWKGENWYRMKKPAGTMIPESVQEWRHCGTASPGWLNGSHPIQKNIKVTSQVCFHGTGGSCEYDTTIDIINCGDYFLYFLPDTPLCFLRYCATDL